MEKAKKTLPVKGEPATAEPPKQPNHTEKIKSQVLAKIGKRPRLHRVEVSKHHNGKYRVNIWEQPESDKNIAVSIGARIGLSYYVTVSETGEIIDSNPPLTKLCCPN
jgi:ABC-type Zn2+ transport system substrate-binding protein/surface adhesin